VVIFPNSFGISPDKRFTRRELRDYMLVMFMEEIIIDYEGERLCELTIAYIEVNCIEAHSRGIVPLR
jgi:hypothetical protein